jgi:hypothetical protein
MFSAQNSSDPAWQEDENRKNCLRIIGLILLALLVIGAIIMIINFATNRGSHAVAKHHLIALKHHAESIG